MPEVMKDLMTHLFERDYENNLQRDPYLTAAISRFCEDSARRLAENPVTMTGFATQGMTLTFANRITVLIVPSPHTPSRPSPIYEINRQKGGEMQQDPPATPITGAE
jgi:hypothetical protein